ncbi:MAG: hypothetical protein J6B85_01180 [Lachnospiraceae bacterium]|nr:hypothetical protein [Lachnospiraceae bacterium]
MDELAVQNASKAEGTNGQIISVQREYPCFGKDMIFIQLLVENLKNSRILPIVDCYLGQIFLDFKAESEKQSLFTCKLLRSRTTITER